MKNLANRFRPLLLALMILLTGHAVADDVWIDYGVLPDGTLYQWRRDNALKVKADVFDVWTRATYETPRSIPTAHGTLDRDAKFVLTTQRVNCKAQTVQVMSASYYSEGEDEDVIYSNDKPQAATAIKAGTVGGRLLVSVCKTMKPR